MTVLFTGSRDYCNVERVQKIRDLFKGQIDTVIHGNCRGMDKAVDIVFRDEPNVKVIPVPANWKEHGIAAGPLRNMKMVMMEPDLVIGFVARGSKGTVNCLALADAGRIPTLRIYLD